MENPNGLECLIMFEEQAQEINRLLKSENPILYEVLVLDHKQVTFTAVLTGSWKRCKKLAKRWNGCVAPSVVVVFPVDESDVPA